MVEWQRPCAYNKMQSKLLCAILLLMTMRVSMGRPSFFVNLPNMLRVDTDEPVSIILEDIKGEANIDLKVQDQSGSVLWSTKGTSKAGSPTILKIKVKAAQVKFPDKGNNVFVNVNVVISAGSQKFQKSARLLISKRSRNVLIQTDKPIYTPRQTVRFRIIPVNVELKPAMTTGVTVEVKNPAGKITKRLDRLVSYKGYVTEKFTLGDTPAIGNWTISGMYSGENTSVQFEVREYVLPRYSLKIQGPPFILPSDRTIRITVTARYVYGKPVRARVELKTGIINDKDDIIDVVQIKDTLSNGAVVFVLPTKVIKDKTDMWFPDRDRLFLSVTAVETVSGHRETTVDSSIYFSKTPHIVSFRKSVNFFKPGLPYEVQMTVRYPNKKPASFSKILLRGTVKTSDGKEAVVNNYRGSSLNVVTDANGNARTTLDIPKGATELNLQAKEESNVIPFDKLKKHKVNSAFSKSKSFLVIRPPKTTPKVGQLMQMEVLTLTAKPFSALHYMVISRGQIQLSRSQKSPGAVTVVNYPVTAAMCPEIRFVAFYQVEHGGSVEIVADQVVVDVEDKFAQEVSIETDKAEYRPGDKAKLKLKGEPNSNAAILAVDKSIYLLREDHRLTKSVVFNKMKNFDLGCGYGGGRDTSMVLKDSGLSLLTNSAVDTPTRNSVGCASQAEDGSRKRRSVEEEQCCRLGEKSRASDLSCRNSWAKREGSELCRRAFMHCCKGKRGRSMLILEDEDADEITEADRQVQFRSNFPETWLFGDVKIGASGTAEMDVVVPDTITTWVLQAFSQGKVTGLGVASPYELVSFKPFFVQLNLPYSVVRGEQLMMSATIFNYAKRKMTSKVYMKAGPELCYERGSGDRSLQQLVRIKANDALTLKYPILPVELGNSNVSVIAYTSDGGDATTRKIMVEVEGIERVKTVSRQIDPSAETEDLQTLTFNADIPKAAIPGSESATLFITGDLLGPIATKLLSSVSKALRNPVEVYQVTDTETYTATVSIPYTRTRTEVYQQTYRTYAPSCTCNVRSGGCVRTRSATRTVTYTDRRNVLRTRTRTVVRQRDRFILQSMAPNVYVLRYLKRMNKLQKEDEERGKGFIQESYRRILGHLTKDGSFSMWGSTTGTLWLTTFVTKNLHDAREFITVDDTVICQAMRFMLKSQKGSGAFLQEGETFSKGMMGGLKGDPAMTAFVLITLQTAQCPQLTVSIDEAIEKAEVYLKSKLAKLNTPYDLALTTYALAMANSDEKYDALEKLEKAAKIDKDDKTMYWDAGSESVSVEATAYALLAFLEVEKLNYVKPILKWLIEHRSADGGFSSGQDTVVALYALSKYSTIQPELNLRMKITSKADPSFRERFFINSRNALVQRSIEVPVGGDVNVEVTGNGIGEAQLELHYNEPKPPTICPFKVDVDIKTLEGSGNYSVDISTCVRFLGTGTVGMSVIELGLPTGFYPLQSTLEKLLNEGTVARFELGDRKVAIFLRQIQKIAATCLSVTLVRSFDVGHLQPAAITVKDFLDQAISCTRLYSLSSKEVFQGRVCKDGKCTCTQARCPACRPRRIKHHFCNMDYACKVKVTSTRQEGGWKIISATVKELFKGKGVLKPNQNVDFWLDEQCRCPSIRRGAKYLIIGLAGNKLTLDRQTFIRRFPNKGKELQEYNRVISRLSSTC